MQYLATVGLLAIFLSGPPQSSPAKSNIVEITITSPKQSYGSGSEIEVTATLRNISDKTILARQELTEIDYQIEVKDIGGGPTLRTAYGQEDRSVIIHTANKILALQPSETITESIPVNKLFDMTMPGRYLVTFYRLWPETGHGTRVPSNSLSITVTP